MRQQKRLSPDRCSAERPASPDTCTRFPAEARVLRRHNTDAQWLTASLSSDEEFDRRMEEEYADEACYAWHDEPHVLILHPPHDRTIVPRHTCGGHDDVRGQWRGDCMLSSLSSDDDCGPKTDQQLHEAVPELDDLSPLDENETPDTLGRSGTRTLSGLRREKVEP